MTDAAQQAERFRSTFTRIADEMRKLIVGQDDVIEGVLTAFFAGGHVLLEGVPGLGKTMLVRTLGEAVDLQFARIQFTPDLMPADIVGTNIIHGDEQGRKAFQFRPGPIFSNLLLADEINRATPKTQSALLEAMQEKQVSVGNTTFELDKPFFVLATQNPIEQEGTYPLPEAQLDRFMFNVWVDYPSYIEELAIVKSTTSDTKVTLRKVLSGEQIMDYQDLIRRIPVADNVLEYAVQLAAKTRIGNPNAPKITTDFITWGAGPRASQYLIIGAKCHAALRGRYSPDIDDVKTVAKAILRHRLVRNYRAEAEGYSMDQIIDELL